MSDTTAVPDRIGIWLNKDGDPSDAAAFLPPLLRILDASFLPKPQALEPIGRKEIPIEGFLDPAVLAAVEGKSKGIRLLGPGLHVELLRPRSGTVLLILFAPGPPAASIRELFIKLVTAMSPSYGRVHLDQLSRELHEAHYADQRRTFYASGLYWLNFFGPDELALQGGDGVAENPHARTERVGNGLLVEVGSDPMEAATPAGEARLVAATKALPAPHRG